MLKRNMKMTNEAYYNKKYNEVIGYIAKNSNEAGTNMSPQYATAKDLLKKVRPTWDDVRVETAVLWDVREWWRRGRRP